MSCHIIDPLSLSIIYTSITTHWSILTNVIDILTTHHSNT